MSLTEVATPPDVPVASPRGHLLSCHLQCVPSPDAPITVLSLVGELDTSTRSHAAISLHAALNRAPGPLIVDLAALTFCSAGGMGLLGDPTSTPGGHPYILAGLSPHLRRVSSVLWPVVPPLLHPTTRDAVADLRSGDRRRTGRPVG